MEPVPCPYQQFTRVLKVAARTKHWSFLTSNQFLSQLGALIKRCVDLFACRGPNEWRIGRKGLPSFLSVNFEDFLCLLLGLISQELPFNMFLCRLMFFVLYCCLSSEFWWKVSPENWIALWQFACAFSWICFVFFWLCPPGDQFLFPCIVIIQIFTDFWSDLIGTPSVVEPWLPAYCIGQLCAILFFR